MHLKAILLCLEVAMFTAAEQVTNEAIHENFGIRRTQSIPTGETALSPAKSQFGNAYRGTQQQQGTQRHLLQRLRASGQNHLDHITQAIAKHMPHPDVARFLHQKKMALSSLKPEIEDGMHHLWNEADDEFHTLSAGIKKKLPVIRGDLKKMAPYIAPAGEIMEHLLARDLELGNEFHSLTADVKNKLPVIHQDLEKVAPYVAPVGEIVGALLARNLELEDELYARSLDWYMLDED